MTQDEIDEAVDEVIAKGPSDYNSLYDMTREVLDKYDFESDAEFDGIMEQIMSNFNL